MMGLRQRPKGDLAALDAEISTLVENLRKAEERRCAFLGTPNDANESVTSRALRREDQVDSLTREWLQPIALPTDHDREKADLERLQTERSNDRYEAAAQLPQLAAQLEKVRGSDAFLKGEPEARAQCDRFDQEVANRQRQVRDADAAIAAISGRLEKVEAAAAAEAQRRLPAEVRCLTEHAEQLAHVLAVCRTVSRRAWTEYCLCTEAAAGRNSAIVAAGGRPEKALVGVGETFPTLAGLEEFRKSPRPPRRDPVPVQPPPGHGDVMNGDQRPEKYTVMPPEVSTPVFGETRL